MSYICKEMFERSKLVQNVSFKNDDSIMNRRKSERYKVIKSKTCRLQNSPIIYMQNLLNKDYAKILNDKKCILSKSLCAVPTTYASAVVEKINSLN